MKTIFRKCSLRAAFLFGLLAFTETGPATQPAPDGGAPIREEDHTGGGAAADMEPAPEIRFTAWNLRNYLHTAAPPPAGSSDRPKSRKEQEAVVATLAGIRPDILGVCEMGSPADLGHLQAALKSAGLDLPHLEHVEAGDPARHLALLSRFPISSRQPATRYRYLLDDNLFPVHRGFLDVTVAVTPAYSLRLVGAHLKSRRDVPEADQALMRRNEAHLLRQHVDTILQSAPDTNLLVYGDFNETRDQPGIKDIKGPRGTSFALTEIAAADSDGHRWTYYYPEADEYSRIDFLLASRGLLPEVEASACFLPGGRLWSLASDHRPVTAVLRSGDTPTKRRRR